MCAGGSLADLCGVWAGRLYPDTKIRVMTFGAPFVSTSSSSTLPWICMLWLHQGQFEL